MKLRLDWFTQNKIEEISFDQILPYWSNHLWPGRQSAITACSAIDLKGCIDMRLMDSTPLFWAYYRRGKIVGVLSGFRTSEVEFRVRGLWVQEHFRGKGVGTGLISTATKKAEQLGCAKIWTMPRATSSGFYIKNGFEMVRETNDFEFGPHYFAIKKIRSDV